MSKAFVWISGNGHVNLNMLHIKKESVSFKSLPFMKTHIYGISTFPGIQRKALKMQVTRFLYSCLNLKMIICGEIYRERFITKKI